MLDIDKNFTKLHKDDPVYLIPMPGGGKINKDAPIHLNPTSGQSGTFMSSKIPGKGMEERT